MHDLEPPTKELTRLVGAVGDAQLDAPTPCGELSVRDLIDHIEGFSAAFAIDEVIVDGWELAVATGQCSARPEDLVAGALEFVQPAVTQSPSGSPGLFGPPVGVRPDAPMLDQLVGLTGRDPGWEATRG